MAIIQLCEATDEGAIGFLHNQEFMTYGDNPEVKYGPFCYWIKYTHVGLCLRDREANGYDDSDFYMLVWNEETQSPSEICFASTRGWSYPCYGSWVDATDEVKAKYAAYCERKQEEYRIADRKAKAKKLRELNRTICIVARNNNASPKKLLKLRKMVSAEVFALILKLLTANLRSEFRKSLRNQVVTWMQQTNGYDKPLSAKQMNYL